MNKPWIQYITEETLPNEDLKILAAIIGLAATIKVMCEVSGMLISVSKNCTLKARIEYIKQHYYGTKKYRYELSKLYDLSENYIYRVVNKR